MKTKLGVFFGGVSPEHEVSAITGLQLMKHVDLHKYELVPVYIDKQGRWWTGPQATQAEFFKNLDPSQPQGLEPFSSDLNQLQAALDVAILCFHGGGGEKGYVQGLLELAGIPYQGPGVTGSALAFDKIYTRMVLTANQIDQPQYVWFTADDWQTDRHRILDQVRALSLPVYLKPANGGSTIGIQKVSQESDLSKTIDQTLKFDSRILVEAEVQDCIEVNVAVLGDQFSAQASVPEQPLGQDELLSFADKYERGGGKKSGMASASRRIPAPISSDLTQQVQDVAVKLFKLFDCRGVVRIDFFVNPSTQQILVTELNTIPGSMSYYLWKATGIQYSQLIDKLVEIAQAAQKRQQDLITSFKTNILKQNKI